MSTTLKSPVPPEAEDAAAPVKAPGGLAWAVFRLHRWALWAWIAYVALAAGVLLWAWGPAANELASLAAACDLGGQTEPSCARNVYQALETYQELMRLGFFAVFGAPFLVGAWAAAAPTAREMETGTAELAWTQSVTPARWLTAKLALPAVVAAAGTTLLLALYRLAHQEGAAAFTAIRHWTPSWYNEDLFTMTGVVMVPRVLCAVAVGVLLGLLLKRSLASLGTGLALLAASTFAVTLGRGYLWPREIRFARAETAGSPYLSLNGSEWQIATGAVTESGELAGDAGETAGYVCMNEGYRDDGPGFDADAFYSCLEDEGYTDIWVAFHNRDDFWPLQLVESGLWLAVALTAVALSYRALRRRTAV
ncbi:ABC transporter permease [Streptomyces sp. NPDC047130]|uniref:ABC transporter permease n=1 Tax=Streptomyces sp. NPDC047130 TaxID=3155261 RepID=UPI0034060989